MFSSMPLSTLALSCLTAHTLSPVFNPTGVRLQWSEGFSLDSLVSHTYKNMSFWGIYLRLLKYVKSEKVQFFGICLYIYTCNIVSFHNNPLRHISVSLIHVEQISVQCCSGTVSTNIHSRNHPLHQRWCDLNKSRRIQPGGFGADQECMAYTLHYAHLSAAIIQTFKKNIYIYAFAWNTLCIYIYVWNCGHIWIHINISCRYPGKYDMFHKLGINIL